MKYGALLTHTARQGSYRDARMAHAMHVAHVDDINQLVSEWRDNDSTDEHKPTEAINAMLPTGWQWLSSGLYRCAYLSPRGTVYKVNRDARDGDEYRGLNYSEMSRILTLSPTLPGRYVIPEATLYHVPGNSRYGTESDYVLAMALVDTSAPLTDCWGSDDGCIECGCAYNEGNARMGIQCSYEAYGPMFAFMNDIHAGNAYPDAMGIVWIVDVAM